MKKRGFTLSELLIALGIVAVTAAMVGPIFSSVIPDKNKIKVISYYNKINEINQKLLSNQNYYYTIYGINDDGDRYVKKPANLSNTYEPIDKPQFITDSLSGNNKYPKLFFYTLNSSLCGLKEWVELEDGSLWKIEMSNTYYSITIDVNGKNGKSCYYENDCKKPDTFRFIIDSDGGVTAWDALTDSYLTNMSSNNQKADKDLAEKFLNDSTKPYNN